MPNLLVKRLFQTAGALAVVGGVIGLFDSLSGAVDSAADEIRDDPLAAIVILIGIAILAAQARDPIFEWFGIANDKRLEVAIRNWLHVDRGYTLVPSVKGPGQSIRIVAQLMERTVTISKMAANPEVTIGSAMAISAADDAILEKMSPVQRADLTCDLVIEVAKVGVHLKIEHKGDHVSRIEVFTLMNEAGLNEDTIIDAILTVFRARQMALFLIVKTFRHAVPEVATEVPATDLTELASVAEPSPDIPEKS